MAQKKARVKVVAFAIAGLAFGAMPAFASVEDSESLSQAQSDRASEISADYENLTYAEFQAEIRAYMHYHAEEALLACLREATSDPGLRGAQLVGPGLKYLKVKQKRYADFRDQAADLSPDDKKQVEVRIIELHLEQKKHIDWARGLYEETTNKALVEYHETGCISGLDDVVREIREATVRP